MNFSFMLKEFDCLMCPVRPFELSSVQQLVFPKLVYRDTFKVL